MVTAQDIERIVATVEGGAANVQDVYPLAPLQEGILFHHLLATAGDPYLTPTVYRFDTRMRLDAFLRALQSVIDRHDILRTGIVWDGVPQAVQVVWRRAPLTVEEFHSQYDGQSLIEELTARFNPRVYRIDITNAPLMRVAIAPDGSSGAWVMVLLTHHLISDHTTRDTVLREIGMQLAGRGSELPPPVPFRNFVAQARLGISREEHEVFFRAMLGDLAEPTVPFGLTDIRGDGSRISEARRILDAELGRRLRSAASAAGVTVATLAHVAWARVLMAASGRDDVVFGSVLFGRMQGGEGAERALGLFMNTLPVRVALPNAGVQQAVRSMHVRLAELMRHEHASLALAQRCSGLPASVPLFNTLLNYRHTPRRGQPLRRVGWEGIDVIGGFDRNNYPLTISVDDFGDAFGLAAQVDTTIDPDHICALMQTALERLAASLANAPLLPLRSLDVLGHEQRAQLITTWNDTNAPFPRGCTIAELVEAQVRKTPDAIAVEHGGVQLTYGQLNAWANQLASYLRESGVGTGDCVALCMKRCPELVVAELAILKCGAAYVPIDEHAPADRQCFMLSDCDVRILLSLVDQEVAGGTGVRRIDLDALSLADHGIGDVPVRNAAESPAYIIYTSGSTGEPKGVVVPHRAIARLLFANRYADFGADDRVAFAANPAFDASTMELWGPLVSGGRIVVVDREVFLDAQHFAEALQRHGVTILFVTTALFNEFAHTIPQSLGALRILLTGGEQNDPRAFANVVREGKPERLIHCYGPTETTTFATIFEVCDLDDAAASIPIGRPIGNTSAYILDERLEPVPIGAAGELYLGGPGLAHGYHKRPRLTAERFVPSPFGKSERLYKTGDLARHRADGSIEFLGRNDFQVKIRGFRAELGEIESALMRCETVREAAVLLREDAGGEKRLVAYYTCFGAANASADSLRAYVCQVLPEYMVPAAFVCLDSMPLNANGKIDRRALPVPDMSAYAARAYEAPAGEIEGTIAQIWCELLGVERVGRHDDFFELGGHSLLAVRLLSRLREELRVELSLTQLFDAPVLEHMAHVASQCGAAELGQIVAVERNGPLPVSFAQQRLWLLAQMDGVSTAYHVTLALRLHGNLDRNALRAALDAIVARHEPLRTTFDVVSGEPVQRIHDAERGVCLIEDDLRGATDADRRLARIRTEEATGAFDLEQGPLIRGRLIHLDEGEHVLIITMHHIVSDGWSMEIFLRELSAFYGAFRDGNPLMLPPLGVQYADYAAWQREHLRGSVLDKQITYWRDALANLPALHNVPTDRPRPPQQDYAGGFVHIDVDPQVTAGLKSLSRRHGTTLFTTLLSAWAMLLARLSGDGDIAIGTPVANRTRAEVQDIIGFFVNTLTLRVDASGAPSVGEFIERVKTRTLQAQEHQDLPFEQVVELLQPPRSLAHTPLFQIMFVWQNNEQRELALPGVHVSPMGAPRTVAKFDLTLELTERDGRIVGNLQYARALFDESTIERYASYFTSVLAAVANDDRQPITRLALLSQTERDRIVSEWNATQTPDGADTCLHELIEAAAALAPDQPALRYADSQMTYAQLNDHANRLARHLREIGVRPDSRVALCGARNAEAVIGLLAIVKAGGAYVPIDPSYPPDRVLYMLQDSAPVALLTAGEVPQDIRPAVERNGIRTIDLRADSHRWAHLAAENLERDGLTPANLAYVLYTSGSTGRPKGVMIEHWHVAGYLRWAGEAYPFERGAVVSSSISFDATITTLLVPLTLGRCVHLLPNGHEIDGLAEYLERGNGGIVKITPLHLDALGRDLEARASRTAIDALVVGGEELSPATAQLWRRIQPHVKIVNEYGPTETVVGCAVYELPAAIPPHRIPIGRPIANMRVYILDERLEPVPVGVTGELYVGGVQVGRGYLNRPDLTAERFVPSPFAPGDRLYKTGDLARYLSDGTVEFLGRNDFQVKIRGFRIELGEIEARLAQHSSIDEVVVVAREDVPGEKRLVAYYTQRGDLQTSVDALRAHVLVTLPEYMAPAGYVSLEALPRTANGKLNRAALPAPSSSGYSSCSYESPVGETEVAVSRVWADLLGVAEVGRCDNFFELGGHSLLAARMLAHVRERLHLAFTLTQVFEHPTLAAFCALAPAARRAMLPPIAPVNRDGPVPVSFAQRRLWFLAQIGGAVSAAYHVPLALRFRGSLDRAALRSALESIVARHEALRTTFSALNGEPVAHVHATKSGLAFEEQDIAPCVDGDSALHQLREQEASAPFDLEAGPLIRGRLISIGHDEHVLLITMHHIVSDGWSMGVFMRELGELYRAHHTGSPHRLAELQIQYADYAAWQRAHMGGNMLRDQLSYWQRTLAGLPALHNVPTDRPRPAEQAYAGGYVRIEIGADATSKLKALSRGHGTTLFTTLLTAWGILLGRLSGQDDIAIGTPVANRGRTEVEDLIGLFVNTLVLRLDLSGAPSIGELLNRVKARALEAQEHQDLPFEQIVEALQPARSLDHTPLFQIMFVWQNNEGGGLALPDIEVSGLRTAGTVAKFDLSLHLAENGEEIAGGIEFATSLFDQATIERYASYFTTVLAAIANDERQPITRLPLLSQTERERILVQWNATDLTYPYDACVHELIEARARHTPDVPALTEGQTQLTYAELNASANRLACYLRHRGVKPESRIALCFDRTADAIVALLAVLKAGGTYVPIDPSYPAERIAYMVSDCVPVIVLAGGDLAAPLRAALQASGAPIIDVASDAEHWSGMPADNLDRGSLTPAHLAYVIYTSGSTGQPKGVMVTHGNLVASTHARAENYGIYERFLLLSPVAFDSSVAGIFGTLCSGGSLFVMSREELMNPGSVRAKVREERITTMLCVPSLLRVVAGDAAHAHDQQEQCHDLRQLIVAGEVFTPALLEHARAFAPAAQIFNEYGPTENTVWATVHTCTPLDTQTVPIGRPITNTRANLLDERLEPVPPGVTGELYLCGAGIARGYLNRADLTAERFIPNPFSCGDRLYRTGDLARYLPDGTIQFVGRTDAQVKVRGYRIELGEIEACLTKHDAVTQAVVILRDDEHGEKRLAAYYTAKRELSADSLRAHLSRLLPEYMIPSRYAWLEHLPLTPNGKVDVRSLPDCAANSSEHTFVPAVGKIETTIARIWSEALHVARVGRGDNFFELGGHSLLAIGVLSRMRDAGLSADVRTLFIAPTLAEFAANTVEMEEIRL